MIQSALRRTCIDVIVPPDHLARVARLAALERPSVAALMAPSLHPADTRLALLKNRKWQVGRTLRVRFLDGPAKLRDAVFEAALEWAKHANVKFVRSDDEDAEVRTTFLVPGYRSTVGLDAMTKPNDEHTMSLGGLGRRTPPEEIRRVALHEFGHAIGCIHEHSSPGGKIPWNRPAVYAFYREHERWDEAMVDANILKVYSETETQFSSFDRASIMIYPIDRSLVTDPAYAVDFSDDLSETDRRFIATAYPYEPEGTVELVVDGAATPAEIAQRGDAQEFRFRLDDTRSCTVETTGSTETQLTLTSSARMKPIEDRGSGDGVNARIREVLERGDYHVRVQHVRPTGRGRYEIRVTTA